MTVGISSTSSLETANAAGADKPKALILVAGVINYYYDVIGYRLAEALRNNGYQVEVTTLRDYIDAGQAYDWFLMVNISEVTVGFGDQPEGIRRISQIRERSRRTAMVLLECVKTNWFAENLRLTYQAGIDMLIDIGFHDQRQDAPAKAQPIYHFMFNGLTNYERSVAYEMIAQTAARAIPWAFIGHLETRRVKFVQRLMNGLDKSGFVYLPVLTHVVENGPHINGQQLQRILENTRYYIWNAHHDYFYIESERFRNALMAGAVPIKVSNFPPPRDDLPFLYLQFHEDDFDVRLRDLDYEEARSRFLHEYAAMPSLESEVARLLLGVAVR